MTADAFHAHLDACRRGRERPFDLCAEGARLLEEAVLGPPPSIQAVIGAGSGVRTMTREEAGLSPDLPPELRPR